MQISHENVRTCGLHDGHLDSRRDDQVTAENRLVEMNRFLGPLEHQDSMGNGRVIRPGEFQYMAAGTGVQHREFNPSPTEPVHLLQIWILPEKKGLKPHYAERTGSQLPGGRLNLVAYFGSGPLSLDTWLVDRRLPEPAQAPGVA